MASSKGSQNVKNLMYPGKHALLPPKIPFTGVSSSYAEYIPSGCIGSKPVQKHREGKTQHQRTSSESHLIDEQPSWLDDLLNEPESPASRSGHRRSSSDSFAYLDATNDSNLGLAMNDYKYKSKISAPHRGIQDCNKNAQDVSFYSDGGYLVASGTSPNWFTHSRENIEAKDMSREADTVLCSLADSKSSVEKLSLDTAMVSPEKGNPNPKPITAEDDNTKRVKQQFAQRSRVRKLQYIAELERKVQALQAEGSGVSAEVEFQKQRNLLLSMENKALKQRLESLAQEKLLKHLEQKVLEREIERLRSFYQQQQQPQRQPRKPLGNHRRATSDDLDSHFANLSLQSKDSNVSITARFRVQ